MLPPMRWAFLNPLGGHKQGQALNRCANGLLVPPAELIGDRELTPRSKYCLAYAITPSYGWQVEENVSAQGL